MITFGNQNTKLLTIIGRNIRSFPDFSQIVERKPFSIQFVGFLLGSTGNHRVDNRRESLPGANHRHMIIGRGFAWLDTGTHDSLYQATNFVQVLEARQGIKIACLEGIAFSKGWISAEELEKIAAPMAKNPYGQYLLDLASGKIQVDEQ